MKRNNILFIVSGALFVLVLANLSTPTSTAAGTHLSADDRSALTSDSGNEPCYPGTGAADPSSVYPVRAYLPLVVSPRSTPMCASEVEPNDNLLAAQAVTAACVASNASDSGEADWYALRLCSPVMLTIRTKGPLTSTLGLGLDLHGDPPGVQIVTSAGPGLEQLITARLIAGVYYARVQPAAGSGAYELWIEARR